MRPADTLLGKLAGVKSTGKGRWMAKCPAHEDGSPSLSIREMDDGRILIYDFGGCQTSDVVAALDLSMGDLFGGPLEHHLPPVARGWTARELLELVAHEAIVANLVIDDALKRPLADNERQRLMQASARISTALDFANGG